jgi:ADP-heptose:LPS heptosyltransferase
MNKILVSRFSALGDVAIAVHVIKAVIEQNPDIEIILLTKKPFRQLFDNIDRVYCFDVDLKNKHKGINGLKKLCSEILNQHEISTFIDLHNVIRTRIINFFLPHKIKKSKINKGKKEKKLLTRKKNKKIFQLKHSAQRYADTFLNAGIDVNLNNYSPNFTHTQTQNIQNFLSTITKPCIGIAPFAAHQTKQYPLDKMETILKILNSKNYNILIFGGGEKEQKISENWQKKYPNVIPVINKFSMKEEICLIDNCKKIITMDSGNMHLASLTNTQIISIWGATHPFLGFSPFKKNDTIYIQKNIPCRPCSVFGNKKCYRKKQYCTDINPQNIIKFVNNL